MPSKFVLYIDDTGSRDPDRTVLPDRYDQMDCFALGGFLLKEEEIPEVRAKHAEFCKQWSIDYPLHSSSIRGGHGKFGWLKKPENSGQFMPALEQLLLSLPIVAIACAIHRPGYIARYKDAYREALWYMCKTAFTVLVERSAKFADENGRNLEIVFEGTGKKEDRAIKQYLKELKRNGVPFSRQNSEGYSPLAPDDFKRIILGDPHQKTKRIPMLQIADLLLYPMAKSGYQQSYRPFVVLKEAGKLIDCCLPPDQTAQRGIKYSCFDGIKN